MAQDELPLPEGFTAPVPFHADHVQATPQSSGVHLVMDSASEIVYVGKTGNLREQLGEHLHGDRQASDAVRQEPGKPHLRR
jgi:hypothetical protein